MLNILILATGYILGHTVALFVENKTLKEALR